MNKNTINFDTWMQGRATRRLVATAFSGGPLARKDGPDDRVLKQWNGSRSPEYPSLETLKKYETEPK